MGKIKRLTHEQACSSIQYELMARTIVRLTNEIEHELCKSALEFLENQKNSPDYENLNQLTLFVTKTLVEKIKEDKPNGKYDTK